MGYKINFYIFIWKYSGLNYSDWPDGGPILSHYNSDDKYNYVEEQNHKLTKLTVTFGPTFQQAIYQCESVIDFSVYYSLTTLM